MPPDTITPIQHKALALLATGVSIAATARACDIHRATIYNWQRLHPDFSTALHDAKREHADHWDAAVHTRAAASLSAVDTLLADPKTPAGVRLKTAIYILDRVTAAPAALPEPIRLPAEIRHISTLDEFQANLDAEEAQIKEFIRRQREAGVEVDLPAAYGLPAHMIPAPLRQAPKQQNSTQFDTSAPLPESVETVGHNAPCPCGSGKKFQQCCLNKPRATVQMTPQP